MNAAESLLRTASAAGVHVCFANPGTTEMPLVAALDAVPEVRAVLGLFEGVCTGAADGYGRMTDRPALTLLHLGPGFANGIANLHNARRAASPIVNLIGDHASWHLEHDAPLTSDIDSLARPVSGWLRTSASANDVAGDAADAIGAATGPPGRVATLVLPADFQAAQSNGPANVAPVRAAADPRADAIEGAAKRLRAAEQPIVLLGGRALREDGLRAAARVRAACGAALISEVFPARWQRGAGLPAPERLPYFPEQAVARLSGSQAVALAGARDPVAFFGYEGVPSRLAPEGASFDFVGEADPARALDALADALDAPATAPSAADVPLPDEPSGALTPATVGALLARALPEGAIVVDEAATSGLPFGLGSGGAARHDVLNLTGGAIGQGLPCAVGAAIACPERKVVAFQADGSSLYTFQSLWTMAREGLDVVVLLCSNRAYRILQVELGRAGVAEPGPQARALTNLDSPAIDWLALARGLGVEGTRVGTAEELKPALARGLAEPGPHFVELCL